jgi:cytochrome oxidase Cu insertion factor (SCO1/SenC/PrrC family)
MPLVPFETAMTRAISTRLALIGALLSALGAPLDAQQPAAAAVPSPDVGTMAPDFALPGATRYGVLRDPVRLSDLRGKTVVLAFFFKARTKG